MQDACIDTRSNYFPTGSPSCGAAGAAADTSTSTCEAVRDGGPAGAWITASSVVKPGSSAAATAFDSGNVSVFGREEREDGFWTRPEKKTKTTSPSSPLPSLQTLFPSHSQVCTSTSKAYFYIQWDPTLCPGKQPPAPRLMAQTGANYKGPSCKRKGESMTQGRAPATAYRGGDVSSTQKKGGFSFWWAILIAAGILGMCALVAVMARRAAAKPPPVVGTGGGGPGVQMAGVPAPPPPGTMAGGPPPPGSFVPGGPPPPPAAAAGGGAGGVQYSFAPPGGAAGATPGVLLTGATDGGGKPPGVGSGYPKI